MINVVEYAKGHPWIAGTVIVVGGFVFIKLSGIFGGGSSAPVSTGGGNAAGDTAASIAQIQGQTQLGLASISAGAASDQYALQSHIAELALTADQGKTSAALQLGMENLKDSVSIAQINAGVATAADANQTSMWSHLIDVISGKNVNAPAADPNLVYLNGRGYNAAQLDAQYSEDKATAAAAKASGQSIIYDPHFGALQNEVPNAVLAKVTGYTGDFGKGGFESWIGQQSASVQMAAAQVLNRYGEPDRIVGFAGR